MFIKVDSIGRLCPGGKLVSMAWARGHLERLLKARPKARHHAALPFEEIPEFMAELRAGA